MAGTLTLAQALEVRDSAVSSVVAVVHEWLEQGDWPEQDLDASDLATVVADRLIALGWITREPRGADEPEEADTWLVDAKAREEMARERLIANDRLTAEKPQWLGATIVTDSDIARSAEEMPLGTVARDKDGDTWQLIRDESVNFGARWAVVTRATPHDYLPFTVI